MIMSRDRYDYDGYDVLDDIFPPEPIITSDSQYTEKKSEKKQPQDDKPKKKYHITKTIIGKGDGKHKALRHELIRQLGGDASVYLMELIFVFETYERLAPRTIVNGYFPLFQTKSGSNSATKYMHEQFNFDYNKQVRIRKKLKGLGLIDFKTGNWNNQILFSVNVDAVRTLIDDESANAGSSLQDNRFNSKAKTVLQKQKDGLNKKCKTVLQNQKDGLNEKCKTVLTKSARLIIRNIKKYLKITLKKPL